MGCGRAQTVPCQGTSRPRFSAHEHDPIFCVSLVPLLEQLFPQLAHWPTPLGGFGVLIALMLAVWWWSGGAREQLVGGQPLIIEREWTKAEAANTLIPAIAQANARRD